jgi:general secretion pathway protein B
VAKAPATAATDDASADTRVLSLQELPADVRSALPQLSIGGSIYSEHPANRFLILNGQTFRENDKVAPDLVLEQIGLKSAVLKHKSYRYRLDY